MQKECLQDQRKRKKLVKLTAHCDMAGMHLSAKNGL